MSTIFAGDEELLSAYEGAKKHLPQDPSEVDDILGDLDNLEVQEILSPLTSPGTSNQPNNGDNAVVVDGSTPFHQPASNPRLQEIINQLLGSCNEEPNALPLRPAVHENNNGFLVPPAVAVRPPPQNYHLLQANVHSRPPRVYNNTAFQQTPMIMAAATTSKNVNQGGGFGHPIGQPIFAEELATSSSHVSFGYQESYGNPFPPTLMHSGGSMVNQDQYFTNKVRALSPLNPRINDQRPYPSYDLHNLANSSHAMNAPAVWPPSSLAPDHMRFSMPNYSYDQRQEVSPFPSTSRIAFASAQGGQHINNFVSAPTENSLELQNGSHPQEWVWDVDQSCSMEVVEDATPLEIIAPSSSNGGVEDKKKKQVLRWTMAEHIAMLHGVSKYGKGNWKIISREFVNSRSPVQIASHYQKFDARQKGNEETEGTSVEHKRKKRKSIHDITIEHLGTSNGTAI